MKRPEPMTLPSDGEASGRSFGGEELEMLRRVLDSGTLTRTRGTVTAEFEERFGAWLDLGFCRAVSSGTAAVHAAIAALDPEPGDEIITTPITDMGAISPIVFQGAVPIFADVDPHTFNLTAATIASKISPRTKAVIVTHLFGNCCDMDPIVELCRDRGLMVIEDCAQAYGATYRGRLVGTLGDIGCFSMQQGKHISTGEGGVVVTGNADLGRRMRLFTDKAWGYGDAAPDHYFLALNYRISELQGAVALAQFEKLPQMLAQRRRSADRLKRLLEDVEGVTAPVVPEDVQHAYWRFPLMVDEDRIKGGNRGLGEFLQQEGIACSPGYLPRLAFECEVLRDHRTFGDSSYPFEGSQRQADPPIRYHRDSTPEAAKVLDSILVLPWNERYQNEHVDYLAECIRRGAQRSAGG